MDETHYPNLTSFVKYPKFHPFPIQNLPYGVFEHNGTMHVGTAIGDYVLDLTHLEEINLLESPDQTFLFDFPSLNKFMSKGRSTWKAVRAQISNLLRDKPGSLADDKNLQEEVLLPMDKVTMHLPFEIKEYTDFYASIYHATNVGTIIRGPENALQPNWLHLPVGYHGRASSVILGGKDIHRPKGQIKPRDADKPYHGPTNFLDFEFEMGFVVGVGNELGKPIPVEKAKDHIFGLVILNDWSARDIQGWEYVPLGPFTAKNFATSISPWVVTLDALDPFRTEKERQEPQPLPYLQNGEGTAYDIVLQTFIQTEQMKNPHKIMESNFKYLYWNIDQMLAHHTVTGCNMRPGDLCGTGTISGPTKESRACMLELTWRGSEPLQLPSGEERKALHDGDTIIMTAFAQNQHYRIGFGEVRTKILPAV